MAQQFIVGGHKNPPVTNNTISEANSYSQLLVNGASFTGQWEDVTAYNSVVVAVKTDQNGTYSVQFSPDGTNVDSTLTRYYRISQTEPPHRFTITRKYCRVVFTNDSGSDQTYFRLQTTFGEKAPLNTPMDATLAQDYDAIVVRPTDETHEIALGRRQGTTLWNKFGFNADIDIGTEVIASFGGTFTPLTTASTLTIVSSSTADDGDPAGTGAQTATIIGIDANREYQTENITFNGTTNVVTTNTWLGVNRIAITASGSGQINAGNISVTATTGGSNQAYILAGEGVTQQCIFFVQANHKALAQWLTLNTLKQSGASPVVTVKGWVFNPGTNTKYEVFRQSIDTSVENTIELSPDHPFVFNSTDVFWLEATTDKDNTIISGRFSLIEFRNVDA